MPMNIMDPEKIRMLLIGILWLLGVGGGIMAMMVTGHTRESTGGSGAWMIVVGVLIAVSGWMAIDYLWYPAKYGHLGIIAYIQLWLKQKF